MIDWDSVYATRSSRMESSEIRDLLALLSLPDIISFAGGIPDPELFPVEAIKGFYDEILGDKKLSSQAMQYSISEGYVPLRENLVKRMTSIGVPCDVSNIFISNGSQQALDFFGKVLVSPGDTALVMSPTYLGALHAFNAYEPRYDVMNPRSNKTPDVYREAAKFAGSQIKFSYFVPDFSNPTGETITLPEREIILDMAEELDIPVIEDAAYSLLRYDGVPVPAIQALDVKRSGSINKTRTVYCGSFSKVFAPGFRIGWVCASQKLIEKLVLAKQAADLHSSTMNQMIASRFMETMLHDHVEKLCHVYKWRRDRMLAALEEFMPPGVMWSRPEGGMFIWLTLPMYFNTKKLLERSIKEIKVAFVPGGAFFADGTGKNTARINYSLASDEQIKEGISRLAGLIKDEMAKAGGL
ncbi:MAG: PLP-dependent aminotransferase family protein [Alphaproteobacteria bacterium]|nr:PLP-dependent aminotransferase family protein [Alphaproteobacteria bacterium]